MEIESPEASLVLRIKAAAGSPQADGIASLQIEVLVNFETICCAQPATLDLDQLNVCLGKPDNAYGRFLGTSVYAALSVQDALRELGDPGKIRVQLMLEGGGFLETIRWERMEIPGWNGGPVAVNPDTPFSRFAAVNRRQEDAPEDQVFRLLVAVASPAADGIYQIDPEEECASVVEACTGLLDRNQLQITLLPGAKLSDSLRKRLLREGVRIVEGAATAERIARELLAAGNPLGGPHGLHLIAHGTYQAESGRFFLLLENEEGGLGARTATDLIENWRPERLRLMVLESCQSGMQDFKPHVSGFMQLLVEAGVPAVLAMQDKVLVADARTFNQGFYSCLLESGRADEAANNGRQLLRDRPGDAWSIPALTTRLRRGAAWVESPLRKAGRLLYAQLEQAQNDRIFPDFPVDVLAIPTARSEGRPVPSGAIDEAPGVQEDVNRWLTSRLKGTAEANQLICLLGDSGSSKTTILESTFLRETPRHWKEEQPSLPVMLRLQDCVFSNLNATTTVAAAISKYFSLQTGLKIETDYIAGRFHERSFLFLISADHDFTQGSLQDGLNILDEFRQAATINHLYVLTLDRNSVNIEDLPNGSECLMLQPMSAERVGEYLRKIPDNDKTGGAGPRLFESLQKNGLFDLAEVPWLLSEMLNQEYRGVGEKSRSDILKRITDERVCHVSGPVGMRARVEEAIYRIAWEVHNRRSGWDSQHRRPPSLPGRDLFGILFELRGNRDFSLSDFRDHLISKCKLLAAVEEDGVRFAYPGFQAYCCAQYIRSQPDPVQVQLLEEITATLGRRSRVEKWSDTLIMLTGLQHDADKVLRLLRMILSGSPLNEGDQVFVAARCLQEAKQTLSEKDLAAIADRPIVRSIISSLIYRSHPLSDGSVLSRKRALRALGPLKDESAVPHLVSLVLKKVRLGKDNDKQFDWSGIRIAAIKALLYTPEVALERITADPELAGNRELHRVVQFWLDLNASELMTEFSSGDPAVASVAAFALGLMKPAGALAKLAGRFKETETDGDLLWAIADSMLELGDPGLAEVAAKSMSTKCLWPYTAYLIGKLGAAYMTPDFHDFLRAHLKDDSPGTEGLRGRCLQSLAEVREDVRDVCYEWLKQKDDTLRYYALQGLRQVGDTQSLTILERLQWNQGNTALFERLRLEVYDDLYWRLAGGLSREVMAPMSNQPG